MTPVSKFALAIALGAFSIVPAGFAADKKDKGKAAAPAGPAFSDGFKKVYGPLIGLDSDKDAKGKPLKPEQIASNLQKAKAVWPQISAAAANDDDKAEAGRFAINVGLQLKDRVMTTQGVDVALSSQTLPADRRGLFTYIKGEQAYFAKDYAAAAPALVAAYDGGYRVQELEYKAALSFFSLKNFTEADKWLGRAMAAQTAANKPIPSFWYAVAADTASNLNDHARASGIYVKLVNAENKPDYWYAALQTYRNFSKPSEEPDLDVLRLMRRTKSLKPSAYGDLVDALARSRFPVELESVIAEGVAAGKLNKSDIPTAEAYVAKSKASFIESLPETETTARATNNSYDIFLAGDAFFSNGDFAKALELYTLSLSRGKVADRGGADVTEEVILRLGITKLELADVAGAKAEFAKVKSPQLAAIANYWTIHANQLGA